MNAFNRYAQEYDDWFVQHESVYHSELAAVKSFLPLNGRALEVGVGTGRFAEPLGIKIGVEPARAMAEIAGKRGIEVIQGYAEALPLAPGSFDVVLMITVLCFLQDPPLALREATRVLKPQGRLIIGMIDPDSPLGRLYQAHQAQSRFFRQARFLRVSQVLRWLGELGYPDPKIRQTIFQDIPVITTPEPAREGYGEGVFVVLVADLQ
ncbi:MAG TPA: SAM-dependent methyltransferase [Desulfobacterales bacterium]|nr:SAM-dependent methyltransferase [Desulfobacterales bacterium]